MEIQVDIGRRVESAGDETLLVAQLAFEIKHLQSAFQHVQVGAQRVVLRCEFPWPWRGGERQLVSAGFLRSERKRDVDLAAIERHGDRSRAERAGLATFVGDRQLDGDPLVDVAIDPDKSAHQQFILDEHGVLVGQILHRHVARLRGGARRPECDRVEGTAQPSEFPSGIVQFHFRSRDGLHAVAEKHDAGQSPAELAADGGPDGRAHVGRTIQRRRGKSLLEVEWLERLRIGPRSHLEITRQLGGRGASGIHGRALRVPTRLAARHVRLAHAAAAIGEHDQRGGLGSSDSLHSRGAEQREHNQQHHREPERRQQEPTGSGQPTITGRHRQQRKQHRGRDSRDDIAVKDWSERPLGHFARP